MFVLILAEDLCCVWFINPVLYLFECPETAPCFINWGQISRLLREDGDTVQSPKHCL
jgi:hypothetical protein